MNKKTSNILKITTYILSFTIVLTSAIFLYHGLKDNTPTGIDDTDTDEVELSAEDDDFYVDELDNVDYEPAFPEKAPLFQTTYLDDVTVDNDAPSINKSYDTFPILNNDNVFQALSETKYENINGKTALAYSFYRYRNKADNNPNVGCGLLMYYTIKYKLAHPEEEVYLDFSSYRISVTAAVCVAPESRYYGYMRALYDRNYDEFGFVTLGFMLVEAARIGIHVTVVGQLPSYSVKQYAADGETLVKVAEPNYKTYFNAALTTDCYDEFEPGKKVSEFFNFKPVEWNLDDKGGTDMMHYKACLSSAYLDSNGEEHHDAVWQSSSNLDTLDYRGAEGGDWSQSGILIADHRYVYLANYNYMQLMAKFSGQEEMYEMKNIVNERNTKQAMLQRQNRIDEIPEDELIVYVGTENDKVFESYETPLGGYPFNWDKDNNPVCRYTSELAESEGPVGFMLHNPRCEPEYSIFDRVSRILKMKFVDNKNIENRLYINGKDFDYTDFKGLKAGRDLAAAYLVYDKGKIHDKDMLYSYIDSKTGLRQYVLIMTSCNFHSGAYHYQTNGFLVVHETEEMGNRFFNGLSYTASKKLFPLDY